MKDGHPVVSEDKFRTEEGDGLDEMGECPSVSRCSPVTDDLDTIFDLLYDSRHRHLLYYLVTGDSDVVELAAAVTAVCNYEAAGTEAAGQPPREEVRSALHHNHLPRLADAAVLDYDHRQGTIRLTGHTELEHWVEHAHSKEIE